MKAGKIGFTMIEVLVVITIIGILVTIGMISYQPTLMRARDAKRKSDLDQVKKALRLYYNDAGRYPVSSSGTIMVGSTTFSWGSEFKVNTMVYMRQLPTSPKPPEYRYYQVDSGPSACTDGQNDFRLVATLENSADPSSLQSHNRCGNSCGYSWSAKDYVVCPD